LYFIQPNTTPVSRAEASLRTMNGHKVKGFIAPKQDSRPSLSHRGMQTGHIESFLMVAIGAKRHQPLLPYALALGCLEGLSFETGADCPEQDLTINRLLQIGNGARLMGEGLRLVVPIGGDEDDRDPRA